METYQDPMNDPNCDPALAMIAAFFREKHRRGADEGDALRAALSLLLQSTLVTGGDDDKLCALIRSEWKRIGSDPSIWTNIPSKPLEQRAKA